MMQLSFKKVLQGILCGLLLYPMAGCKQTAPNVANVVKVGQDLNQWDNSLQLPTPQGVAGTFAGMVGDRLIVAGGTNFPDATPWNGGHKTWYRTVYSRNVHQPEAEWQTYEEGLPTALGYGCSIPLADGLLCIGGCDAQQCYNKVFRLYFEGETLQTDNNWPDLPVPLANATAALLEGKIYIAGGQEHMQEEVATHHFFMLDLQAKEKGWQTLPTWPGEARGYAVSAAQGKGAEAAFYLFSGRDYHPGYMQVLTDGYRYLPAQESWEPLAPEFPLMAGTAAAFGEEYLLFFGGVPRLIPGSDEHPGFDNSLRWYHIPSDRIARKDTVPYPIPVTTVLVRDGERSFYMGSGEVKPGIRTPHLLRADLSEAELPAVAHETSCVFQKGESGYACFRIPAIIKSRSGELLAFAEARKNSCSDTGNIDLVMKRSANGGKTWGTLSCVWDDGENVCGNPAPIVDQQSGRIVLVMTWNAGEDKEPEIYEQTSKDTRRVFVCYSDDEGKSWSKPQEITSAVKQSDWTWYATGPCHGIQLQNGPHKGRLVVSANHVVAGSKEFHSHLIYSDDCGETWQLGGISEVGGNESTVAELADGSLLLNMRNYNRQTSRTRSYSISIDQGASLQEMHYQPELIEPICQGSILRFERTKANPLLLFSNPSSERLRERMTIHVSEDQGATWPHALLVYPGAAAYSDMVQLDEKHVGLLYEYGYNDCYQQIGFSQIQVVE